jgi:hypothetical protein
MTIEAVSSPIELRSRREKRTTPNESCTGMAKRHAMPVSTMLGAKNER